MHINTGKVGCVFGTFLGGVHLVWALLVFLGWAQPLINFSLWAHMIQLPYVVGPFNLSAAATLVVFTSFLGYIFGSVVAMVWNKVHQS
ncbi:MAG: hypothetical protein HZC03_00175 [Candidatus Lloydbacteria bacterium]|nr:hypothetical protein [Candidatus Lloydbacteria bacterium]